MMEYKKINMKKNRELMFFKQLDVSERTRNNYLRAIRSTFLKDILYEHCGTNNLFELDDIKKIWDVYSIINLHPKKNSNHIFHVKSYHIFFVLQNPPAALYDYFFVRIKFIVGLVFNNIYRDICFFSEFAQIIFYIFFSFFKKHAFT